MDDDGTTRRRVLEAGGLLGAFGVSGCLRLTQADDGNETTQAPTSATTTERATTTAEPTETTETTETTTEPLEYPPGVSEDGVSAVVVQSHLGELAGKQMTVETEYMHRRRTAKVASDAVALTTSEGVEMYVADGQTYQRYDAAGQTFWGHYDRVLNGYERRSLVGEDVMRAILRGGDFAVTGTDTEDGDPVFVVAAEELADASVFETTNGVSRYFRDSEFPIEGISASGRITPDGVVTELQAYLQAGGENGRFSVSTTAIGSTDVSKPDWAATAKAEQAQFDASVVDGDQYIAFEHVGGQSIDCSGRVDCEVDAYDDRSYLDGSFTGTLSEGDTLYLYKTDEETSWGDRKLGVSKNEKPSSAPADPWVSGAEVNVRLDHFQLVTYFPAS